MNYLMSLILFLVLCMHTHEIPLLIHVDEMRSPKGNISVSVFVDQSSFKSEKPILHKTFSKDQYSDGRSFSCSIDLPKGNYGIVILDDENTDGEMNYNWVGIPKEGYGFSHFVHTGFSKPNFSDFVFTLNDSLKDINITLRYF